MEHHRQFKGKKAVVFGGLGFLGSNLAIALVKLGADVTIYDCLLPLQGGNFANIDSISGDVRVLLKDVRADENLGAVISNADFIFLLTGQTSHRASMAEPLLDFEINCLSNLKILNICRQTDSAAAIVFASTRQVYGRVEAFPVTERHPVAPTDINGISNISFEHCCRLFAEVYKMKCTVLRLTNTYGPRLQIDGLNGGVIGTFIRKALSQEVLEIYGDGDQVRDLNFVDDVTEAFIAAAAFSDIGVGPFNLGSGVGCTLNQFVGHLNDVIPVSVRYLQYPEELRSIDIGSYVADIDVFKDKFGWSPKVGLKKGLEETISYFFDKRSKYL